MFDLLAVKACSLLQGLVCDRMFIDASFDGVQVISVGGITNWVAPIGCMPIDGRKGLGCHHVATRISLLVLPLSGTTFQNLRA